ncbi:MAG: cytochrome b [Pseudomonadota bacterium]
MQRADIDNSRYDFISRLNHWIIAVAIIGMLIFGIYIFQFVPSGPEKGALIGIHKAIGFLILIYGIWRVSYRLFQGFLEDAAPMPKWQSVTARSVHILLLAGVIIMPLSGFIGNFFGGRTIEVFGLLTIPGGPKVEAISNVAYGVHVNFAWIMVVAVVLHILGALKHQLVDHDATLRRMVGRP